MIGRIEVHRAAQIDDIRGRIKRVGEALGADTIRIALFAAKLSDGLRSTLATNPAGPVCVEVEMITGSGIPRLAASVVLDDLAQSTRSLPIDAAIAANQEGGGLDAARRILAERSRIELLTEIQEQNEALLERGKALEEALRKAEAATEAKSTFLASMSHELRTPLNSILGFTKRLKKRLSDAISERDFDALLTIERNGRHLLTLINDILDLSKIEAGRMELVVESVSLVPLLQEVISQCEPLTSPEQALLLEVPEDACVVRADVTKIRQIVMNLVSNAIKYSEKGTVEVLLAWRADEKLGHAYAIDVCDHGAGMTTEQAGQLFERFTRLDTEATRRVGGTGLGLTISAKYATMHGGRIDVASTVGVGSTFTLLLPHDSAPPKRRAPKDEKLLVLCADTDDAFLDAAKRLLRRSEVEILTVRDRATILDLANEHRPDVICLGPDLADLRPTLERALENAIPVVEISGRTPQMSPLKLREAVGDMRESIQRTLSTQLSKVLIVEDNPDARNLLVSAFDELGTRTVVATTGEEAIQILADDETPAAILLDLMLPGLSGFDVARFVRSTERLASIPIVVVSAMHLSSVQLARIEVFADAVLEKGEGVIGRAIDATLAASTRQATSASRRRDEPSDGDTGGSVDAGEAVESRPQKRGQD